MRVIQILQDLFSICRPHLDLRLLHTLFSSIEALTRCRKLTITSIARSLQRDCTVKNKIKTIDRLFGHAKVQGLIPIFYQSMMHKLIAPGSQPIIIIDWSGLTHCGKYHFLRAAVPVKGRALPILDMPFEQKQCGSPKAHQTFLLELKRRLPENCRPIIVTDAGFRVPWFRLIQKLKWNYIGRIRHRIYCRRKEENFWVPVKSIYSQVKSFSDCLGQYFLTKTQKFETYFHLYQDFKKNRVRKNLKGKKIQCSVSLKHAKRGVEPWLLATSLKPDFFTPQKVVEIYKKRMQIEEGFRDLKNERTGLSLRQNRSSTIGRLSVALLIGAMTLFLLWILGTVAKCKNLHYQYQANTVRYHDVLSNFVIGWQVLEENRLRFSKNEINQAVINIREMLYA